MRAHLEQHAYSNSLRELSGIGAPVCNRLKAWNIETDRKNNRSDFIKRKAGCKPALHSQEFRLRWRTFCEKQKPVNNEKKFRIGVLGSGKGSNFVAIADACAAGKIPADIAIVISDVADAGILQRARERNLPADFLAPGKFRTKLDEDAERILIQKLLDAQVDLVVLAGFMRILKGEFLRVFAHRVVNIHPSLLPAFPGLESWKQALDYGVKFTGCTVHFVDQGVDTGPIIAQQTVPVLAGDTAETLHQRIQQAEWELYPESVAALARGEVEVQGRQTIWKTRQN